MFKNMNGTFHAYSPCKWTSLCGIDNGAGEDNFQDSGGSYAPRYECDFVGVDEFLPNGFCEAELVQGLGKIGWQPCSRGADECQGTAKG